MINTRQEELEAEIFRIVFEYPDGLGANEIAKKIKLKGLGSKPTVLNTLKKLSNEKMLNCIASSKHKQKTLYIISRSYEQLFQNFKIIINRGNWLYTYLMRLDYAFSNSLFESSSQAKEYYEDFKQQFIILASSIYLMADHLSEPFPERFKGQFFYKAHQVVNDAFKLFSRIVNKHRLEHKQLDLTLEPELKLNNLITQNEFLNWINSSNIIKEEQKKILSHTFKPSIFYFYKTRIKPIKER